jgi:hypothetical protein
MLVIVAVVAWGLWQYLQSAGPPSEPVAPAPTPAGVSVVPVPAVVPAAVPAAPAAAPAAPAAVTAVTPSPKPALPTFDEVSDLTERGRAMAKFLGAQRLRSWFRGALTVLDDGQVKWSYVFDRPAVLADFSGGSFAVRGRALELRSVEMAFRCPLRGDISIAVEGHLIAADAGAAWTALAVTWHHESNRERAFSFTKGVAELSETVSGRRAVVDSKPFALKRGEHVRYDVIQRGDYCVVTVLGGPTLEGRFHDGAEGFLRLASKACASACVSLEIIGTAPAGWLRRNVE